MAVLRVISLMLGLAMVSGCDVEQRVTRLEKQNTELKAKAEKDHVARDYDLKAKCSKDARTWFNENWEREKNTRLLDFSNHYQATSNNCFILVEIHSVDDDLGSWTSSVMLWNVYEKFEGGKLR